MSNKQKLYFFALGATGHGISGGDRIFIELARRWGKNNSLTIITTIEGVEMCKRQNLFAKILIIKKVGLDWLRFSFLINYIFKIIAGVYIGLTIKLEEPKETILYSASEYWMDSFPAIIAKLRYPKTTWVAAWFQTAPNPLKGYAEADRTKVHRFSAFYNWLVQLFVKPLIVWRADKVLVNNEVERSQFPQLDKKGNVAVLIGAVRLDDIKNWKLKIGKLPKVYDAVFQGRFHPQKGVVELIDIWKRVVNKRPDAKLAMIGDGPLMKSVKRKVKSQKLKKNVKLFGYVFDGPKKYKIFSQSKIVVHPAFFDSGGMASAEAMAFGLPCVGFNLKAYKSYYPKGMVKVKKGDIEDFASESLKLLENDNLYKKIAKEAVDMIEENWSWEKRSNEILKAIL